MTRNFDIRQHVTDTIIAQIEAGTPPWRKPWTGDMSGASFPLRHNGETYNGINILMLWATAHQRGYNSARWMTFNRRSRWADRFARARKRRNRSSMVRSSGRTRRPRAREKKANAGSASPRSTMSSMPIRSTACRRSTISVPSRPAIWVPGPIRFWRLSSPGPVPRSSPRRSPAPITTR